MKIAVFTALFGNRGRLWSPPPVAIGGADFIAFTEKRRDEVGLWQYQEGTLTIVPGTHNFPTLLPSWEQRLVEVQVDNRRTARFYKLMVHEVLSEYDASIWVDANIRLRITPEEAMRWLGGHDVAVFKHPDRDCLVDEAAFCISVGKGNRGRLRRQVRRYLEEGMPRHWGLASTRCVIRRHVGAIEELNRLWLNELNMFSVRDQISFPYVCWKLGLRWSIIPGVALRHRHFWYMKHKEVP